MFRDKIIIFFIYIIFDIELVVKEIIMIKDGKFLMKGIYKDILSYMENKVYNV